jgi:hypothetical protein
MNIRKDSGGHSMGHAEEILASLAEQHCTICGKQPVPGATICLPCAMRDSDDLEFTLEMAPAPVPVAPGPMRKSVRSTGTAARRRRAISRR